MPVGAGSLPGGPGVGAHCWGSEESGAGRGYERGVGVWGFGTKNPARARRIAMVGRGSGVGLLFEIWIVDASIFVVCCVHCHV